MPIRVSPISAFRDNYIWMICENGSNEVSVVDPGDSEPVLAVLRKEGLSLSSILITHHHADHTGGVKTLLEHFPDVEIYGPMHGTFPIITAAVLDQDRLHVAGMDLRVIQVPGHTLDHIAYYCEIPNSPSAETAGMLFCGDTLFAGGCGRIFEGSPDMMYNSLQKLATLPPAIMVYCAHEYTQANLRFALCVEPSNADVIERLRQVSEARNLEEPTVPSSLSLELRTNPFLRCHIHAVRKSVLESMAISSASSDIEIFAALRRWKDNFSG